MSSALPTAPVSTTTAAEARRHSRLLFTLVALTAVLFICALCVGPVALGPVALIDTLVHGSPLATIVIELRLPRALLALIVGASLGLAGAALQGLLRNPLAEPGIIGISGTAAFGAVLAFYTGAATLAFWVLSACGMAGALLAVIAVHALAGARADNATLILAGVAINALASALTALVLNLSPNPFAAYEIFFWLLGSLANRSLEHVWLTLPCFVLGAGLLWRAAPGLDALALGEDTAASLGIDLGALRARIIAGTALAVGSAVAVTGVVGFVGLIVPHLLRPWVGQRPGALLGVSAWGGAALLLAADLGTRLPFAGGELKLGVVTALIGAPFFLRLVVLRRSHP